MLMDINSCNPPLRASSVSRWQPTILYVEPNSTLRYFMSDMFDLAGWHVRRAYDLFSAESCLRSDERYALCLTGEELPTLKTIPGRSGLELVTLARSLPHRKELPILYFSIEDREREAIEAGANAFLRKPHDLFLMVDTIRTLIEAGREK